MIEIFRDCFDFIMHPIAFHRSLARSREQMALCENPDEDVNPISTLNIILISWLFAMVSDFYSLLSLREMDFSELAKLAGFEGTDALMIDGISYSYIKFVTFMTIGILIIFPILQYTHIVISRLIIRFFYFIFSDGETASDDIKKSISDVVNQSYISYFALIIPGVGQVFCIGLYFFYLVMGMRVNLKFTMLEAILTLILPIVFIVMAFILFFVTLSINL